MTKLSTTKTASKKATTSKSTSVAATPSKTSTSKPVAKKEVSNTSKSTTKISAKTPTKPVAKIVAKTTKTAKSSKPATKTINRSAVTIEKAVAVINYAVESKITLAEASRAKGFGRNYVSDIKGRVDKNFAKNNINKTQYANFNSAYKRYEKTVK
jgi:hypothetical protein